MADGVIESIDPYFKFWSIRGGELDLYDVSEIDPEPVDIVE